MFEDARTENRVDKMALVVNDIEEWLEDNGYDTGAVQRSGRFEWDAPGYGVVAENDAVTVAYLSEMGGTPAMRTYMLEELWGMDEDEWMGELDELAEEG